MNEQTPLQQFVRSIDNWFKRQGPKRLTLFCVGSLLYEIILGAATWYLNHHPHQPMPGACAGVVALTVVFFVTWSLICFRRSKDNYRNLKSVAVWVITAYMLLFLTAPHSQAAQPPAGDGAALTQAGQVDSQAQPHIIIPLCTLLWIIGFIIIGSIAWWLVWSFCKAAGLCGKTGSQPPQSPGGGGGTNNVIRANLQPAGLTNTTFYLQNGQIVSNSAGMNISQLPPLFSIAGVPVANGSQLGVDAPGISTFPAIGLWVETNTCSDSNLDPTHNYQVVYNFTLLTTTNMALGWQEVATVVGWVNDNQSVPLVATITYQNGVPLTTNWTQIYLDHTTPTNIVVWGNIANPAIGTSSPFLAKDIPTPPGGGGSTNSVSLPDTSVRLYRLTCNTNAISTTWPPQ